MALTAACCQSCMISDDTAAMAHAMMVIALIALNVLVILVSFLMYGMIPQGLGIAPQLLQSYFITSAG